MTVHLFDFVGATDQAKILNRQGAYCDQYLADAMAACGDGVIQFPKGKMLFAQTIHVKHRTRFEGDESGLFGSPVTEWKFDANVSGVVFHRNDTDENGIASQPRPNLPDGAGLRGIYLYANSGTDPDCHGVWMRSRAYMEHCIVNRFPGHGIQVKAEATSTNPLLRGNSNGFMLNAVVAKSNGRCGVYVDGADANAGIGTLVDVSQNGEWGIFDSSFLGNTWVACHAAANVLGPYKSDNANSRDVWVGCYSESGQPKSHIDSGKGLVLGGLHGAGISGKAATFVDGKLSPMTINAGNGAHLGKDAEIWTNICRNWPSLFDMVAKGDNQYGWSTSYYDEQRKAWNFRYKRQQGNTVAVLTTDQSAYVDENLSTIGGGQWIFPKGFYIPSDMPGRFRKVETTTLLAIIRAFEASGNS